MRFIVCAFLMIVLLYLYTLTCFKSNCFYNDKLFKMYSYLSDKITKFSLNPKIFKAASNFKYKQKIKNLYSILFLIIKLLLLIIFIIQSIKYPSIYKLKALFITEITDTKISRIF